MEESERELAKHYMEEIIRVTGASPEPIPFIAALSCLVAQGCLCQPDPEGCLDLFHKNTSIQLVLLKNA